MKIDENDEQKEVKIGGMVKMGHDHLLLHDHLVRNFLHKICHMKMMGL